MERNGGLCLMVALVIVGACSRGASPQVVTAAAPNTSSPLSGDLKELSSSMSAENSYNNSGWASYIETVPNPGKRALEFASGSVEGLECPTGFAAAVAAGATSPPVLLNSKDSAAKFLAVDFGWLPAGLSATGKPYVAKDEAVNGLWEFRLRATGEPPGTPTTWGDWPPTIQVRVSQVTKNATAYERIRHRNLIEPGALDGLVLREGTVCGAPFLVATTGSLLEARGQVSPWVHLAGPGSRVIGLLGADLSLADTLRVGLELYNGSSGGNTQDES